MKFYGHDAHYLGDLYELDGAYLTYIISFPTTYETYFLKSIPWKSEEIYLVY